MVVVQTATFVSEVHLQDWNDRLCGIAVIRGSHLYVRKWPHPDLHHPLIKEFAKGRETTRFGPLANHYKDSTIYVLLHTSVIFYAPHVTFRLRICMRRRNDVAT